MRTYTYTLYTFVGGGGNTNIHTIFSGIDTNILLWGHIQNVLWAHTQLHRGETYKCPGVDEADVGAIRAEPWRPSSVVPR